MNSLINISPCFVYMIALCSALSSCKATPNLDQVANGHDVVCISFTICDTHGVGNNVESILYVTGRIIFPDKRNEDLRQLFIEQNFIKFESDDPIFSDMTLFLDTVHIGDASSSKSWSQAYSIYQRKQRRGKDVIAGMYYDGKTPEDIEPYVVGRDYQIDYGNAQATIYCFDEVDGYDLVLYLDLYNKIGTSEITTAFSSEFSGFVSFQISGLDSQVGGSK